MISGDNGDNGENQEDTETDTEESVIEEDTVIEDEEGEGGRGETNEAREEVKKKSLLTGYKVFQKEYYVSLF